MAVAFDATVSVEGGGVSTLTTAAFTIAGSNRAGALGLSHFGNNSTSFTGSIGGTSGGLVVGTDSTTAQTARAMIFSVVAPPTGSKTATMSWTTGHDAMLGALTATGVDQTAPMNNGTFASGTGGTNPSVTITSTNGDLTLDTVEGSNAFPSAPTRTQRWLGSTTCGGAGSTGPGTGTTTHGWTLSASDWASAGANFVQAAAAAVSGPPIMGRMVMVNP